MKCSLYASSYIAALLCASLVGWSALMPTSAGTDSLSGGFCIDNHACASQFTADCLGNNCPANTTHEECQDTLEANNKNCKINGNCKDTAGCDDHGDCTCS